MFAIYQGHVVLVSTRFLRLALGSQYVTYRMCIPRSTIYYIYNGIVFYQVAPKSYRHVVIKHAISMCIFSTAMYKLLSTTHMIFLKPLVSKRSPRQQRNTISVPYTCRDISQFSQFLFVSKLSYMISSFAFVKTSIFLETIFRN